jgi:hypothetical protein
MVSYGDKNTWVNLHGIVPPLLQLTPKNCAVIAGAVLTGGGNDTDTLNGSVDVNDTTS